MDSTWWYFYYWFEHYRSIKRHFCSIEPYEKKNKKWLFALSTWAYCVQTNTPKQSNDGQTKKKHLKYLIMMETNISQRLDIRDTENYCKKQMQNKSNKSIN